MRSIDPRSGGIITQFCAPIGHRQLDGDYVESWQPQPMESYAMASATSIAARVTGAPADGQELGGRGIFGVELFIRAMTSTSPRSVPARTTRAWSPWPASGSRVRDPRARDPGPASRRDAGLPGASAVIYGRRDDEVIGFANLAQALSVPETSLRLFGKPMATPRRRMGVVTATADDGRAPGTGPPTPRR